MKFSNNRTKLLKIIIQRMFLNNDINNIVENNFFLLFSLKLLSKMTIITIRSIWNKLLMEIGAINRINNTTSYNQQQSSSFNNLSASQSESSDNSPKTKLAGNDSLEISNTSLNNLTENENDKFTETESKTDSTGNSEKGKNLNQSTTETVQKSSISGDDDLSEEEQEAVEDLEATDKIVKAHEAAHQAAGSGLVKGKSFSYTTGPDGKRYATAGEVQIDMSYDLSKPQETIQKMQQVIRAALAPADPSGQDISVANNAARIITKATNAMSSQNETSSSTTQNTAQALKSYSRTSFDSNLASPGAIVDFTIAPSSTKLFKSKYDYQA